MLFLNLIHIHPEYSCHETEDHTEQNYECLLQIMEYLFNQNSKHFELTKISIDFLQSKKVIFF